MFTPKSKAEQEKTPLGSNSLIGSGTIITGDVVSSVDIRIDGILKGNIWVSAKIVLGKDGVVEGNIESHQADIMGKVHGRIIVKDLLSLRGHAEVKGDIRAGKLEIEPSVTFNGMCQMGEANVVEMNKEEQKHAFAR